MTISWRRLGFLGFMIPLAFWGLALIIWGHSNFTAARVALALSAVAVWIVGSRLNADGPDDDGKAMHLTFGFPMQWAVWVPIAGFLLTLA